MTQLFFEKQNQVGIITINRPDKGNILTLDLVIQLTERIKSASEDCLCVLIQSNGENFCLGRDSSEATSAKSALEIRNKIISPMMDLYDSIKHSQIPVIAKVQGRAVGLGCAIAGVCDLAIASEDAIFQLPEMEKNLPPTLAISALIDKVGKKAVASMVYSMEFINAQRALQIGVVSSVVKRAELNKSVETLINQITSRNPIAVKAVKEYLNYAPESGHSVRSMASNLLAVALSSKDQ